MRQKLKRRNWSDRENISKTMSELLDKKYDIEEIAFAYDLQVDECKEMINQYHIEQAYKAMAKGKIYEKIDMGKVGALKRAGWTLEMIGTKFGKTAKEMIEIIEAWQQDTGKDRIWLGAL